MKILIAEDDPISRRILEANLLEWGYEVMVASDGGEAWEIIQQPESPSLIISDWMMPRMDGLALCRKIRNMEKSEYIYFIILTAKGEKKDIIEGLEAGADDFLTKPFNREELKYRIRIGERIINLERRILELANTDSLTCLLNRRAFMERMEQEMSRAQREKKPISLILVDIDHFKNVNDTYGHQVGDLALQRFSGELTASARPYDFLKIWRRGVCGLFAGSRRVASRFSCRKNAQTDRKYGNHAAGQLRIDSDHCQLWYGFHLC